MNNINTILFAYVYNVKLHYGALTVYFCSNIIIFHNFEQTVDFSIFQIEN